MNEEQWLVSVYPYEMIQAMPRVGYLPYANGPPWISLASDRKIRLLAIACCYEIWDMIEAPWKKYVEAAELYVEGGMSKEQLRECSENPPPNGLSSNHANTAAWCSSHEYGNLNTRAMVHANIVKPNRISIGVSEYIDESQTALVRDIFGNPFRSNPMKKEWLTSTVISIAQHMYESKCFDGMPILADALEDAGCDDTTMLDHCRRSHSKPLHVRGCWIIDLILGKK